MTFLSEICMHGKRQGSKLSQTSREFGQKCTAPQPNLSLKISTWKNELFFVIFTFSFKLCFFKFYCLFKFHITCIYENVAIGMRTVIWTVEAILCVCFLKESWFILWKIEYLFTANKFSVDFIYNTLSLI